MYKSSMGLADAEAAIEDQKTAKVRRDAARRENAWRGPGNARRGPGSTWGNPDLVWRNDPGRGTDSASILKKYRNRRFKRT